MTTAAAATAQAWEQHFEVMRNTEPDTWGPLPHNPELALLADGTVRPDVKEYFDGLAKQYLDGLAKRPIRVDLYRYFGYMAEMHEEVSVRETIEAIEPVLEALNARKDLVHVLLLACYGMPKQVRIADVNMFAWGFVGEGQHYTRQIAMETWLRKEFQRIHCNQ